MGYEQFTDRARRAMALAAQAARQWQHQFVGTEHMLIGLVDEGGGVAAHVLSELGVALPKVRNAVEARMQRGPDEVAPGRLPQTPRAKRAIECAIDEMRDLGHSLMGTEHLLLGLMRVADGVAAQTLCTFTDRDTVRAKVAELRDRGDGEARENARREAMVCFWRQFGILLSSGVPALKALEIQQQELPVVRDPLRLVADAIRNGKTMGQAIARLPELFASSVVALCRAGETGGVLDVVAERIANGLESGALAFSGEPSEGQEPVKPGATNWGQVLVDLITDAVRAGASDMHFEPTRDGGQVRHRIDGVVQAPQPVDRDTYDALIGRLKVLANLNVAESRLPQDGRAQLKVDGRDLDVRVSLCRYATGVSAVIRVLDRAVVPLDIGQLGCAPETLEQLTDWTRRPHGLHIVAGPTGCGKTTLLYALLSILNTPDKKILSVEDPVEFLIDGVLQAGIRPEIGLTFARTVRAFLRQAPNVIMVGEIRDRETANVVVQASLTGHLVLSTLHTANATEVPGRLVDIGLDPWLVSVSLQGVVSMRLVRQACAHCAEEVEPDEALVAGVLADLPDADALRTGPFRHGVGCDHCHHTGYRGRTALYEILPQEPDLQAMVRASASPKDLRRAAVEAGMVTLRHDGVRKAVQGITTLEEVLRVSYGTD